MCTIGFFNAENGGLCLIVLIHTYLTGLPIKAQHLSIETLVCKGDSRLTCAVDSLNPSSDGWAWYGPNSASAIMTNGVEIEPVGKYTEETTTSTFTLTIHSTQPGDAGSYHCEHNFKMSDVGTLHITCNASEFSCNTTSDERLVITVDYSFPAATFTSVTALNDQSNDGSSVSLSGSLSFSSNTDGSFVTIWTSNEVLETGENTVYIIAEPGGVSHTCVVPVASGGTTATSGLPGGAIAGIVIAVIVLIFAIAVVVLIVAMKCRRRNSCKREQTTAFQNLSFKMEEN